MHNKSNLLLLTLFTLTIGIVGWLGYKLTSQQDQQIKMSQINRSEQALLLIQNNITQYLQSQNNNLSVLINSSHNDINTVIKTNPLIHDVLIFDDNNELLFPIVLPLEKQKVAYQWLKSIAKTTETQAPKKFSKHLFSNGWFTWYDQQKEKYIYWSKNRSNILFVELNNSMFMASFIHHLAQQPTISDTAYLQIIDNIGRTFYQWGDVKLLNNADFDIQKNLHSPLAGWSLRYYSKIESLSSLSKGLFQIVIVGMIVLLSIITFVLFQIKRREQNEAQQRLSFINQVTHELKTPLTNIRLHGELLERTLTNQLDNGNTSQSLAIIQQESERLSRLINNVLNFNSIEKKTLQLNFTDIELKELINQAILPFQPSFQQLDIAIDLQDEINHKVNVDVDVFKQIIGNLMSNVEKYAPEAKNISINAFVDSDCINIIFKDYGKGIAQRFSEKIFTPFYRIHNHLTSAAGSGLGLGLARDLARLHGGDLVLVNSKQGACFKLTIKENNNA